jgi:predicted N-acyltransferase
MSDYVIRVETSPRGVDATQWDTLLASQKHSTPFMRHAYLAAMYESGSATERTGWDVRFFLLSDASGLAAAGVLYLKEHSYGEYVFDWAWASAYQQHGVPYYPKAISAIPFTPVPGTRLLAVDRRARSALLGAMIDWCSSRKLSSLHLLFGDPQDAAACQDVGMMLRHTVQFHWHNVAPKYADFEQFLKSLSQEKRKKIRQERKKVSDAGVTFHAVQGATITSEEWDFFYRCYERTYLEHGNPPYLSRDFFTRMANSMPENWLLFIGSRDGTRMASSLLGISAMISDSRTEKVAFGRYWGALERVDCLHFEACYYTPLQWCIENGFDRFEGGAQGEHKMARALMPVQATSAHWVADPAFADAVARFLEREDQGIANYMQDLEQRSPFRKANP